VGHPVGSARSHEWDIRLARLGVMSGSPGGWPRTHQLCVRWHLSYISQRSERSDAASAQRRGVPTRFGPQPAEDAQRATCVQIPRIPLLLLTTERAKRCGKYLLPRRGQRNPRGARKLCNAYRVSNPRFRPSNGASEVMRQAPSADARSHVRPSTRSEKLCNSHACSKNLLYLLPPRSERSDAASANKRPSKPSYAPE
jgi:hypothetical protein